MSQTLVTVTAVKSFRFDGQTIMKGRAVTMSPIQAAIQSRRGNVTLSRSMKAETEPPKPTRGRRRRAAEHPAHDDSASQAYRRRDMTAEDPT